jgi:hypothetical protein
MGKLRVYPPVKFFTAITTSSGLLLSGVEKKLREVLSEIQDSSAQYNFDEFTHYYESEMGKGLNKKMIAFSRLGPAEILPDIKIATNLVEAEYLQDGRRQVNIDPGYVTAAKMVLATTKDYDHRLYLGRGIFGDVHYRFRRGHFQMMEWTYPDYRQPAIVEFFEQLRNRYMSQLKDWINLA